MPKNTTDELKLIWKKIADPEYVEADDELSRLKQCHDHFHECVKQPAQSDSLECALHKDQHLRLIGYVRQGHEKTVDEQKNAIEEYCKEHGHLLVDTVVNTSNSSAALEEALFELDHADGLIISDLLRLFGHEKDPVRDILHLIQHNFFFRSKHLICVDAKLDSQSCKGQAKLVRFLREVNDASRRPAEGLLTMENANMNMHSEEQTSAQADAL